MNLFKKLIRRGLNKSLTLEEKQHIVVTNSVALIVSFLYLFYALYGVYAEGFRTILISLAFMIVSLLSYGLNSNGRLGIAKVLLMGIASFSVFLTYHVYTLSEAILTIYFPILLGYVFFFDFSQEKKYFFISFLITLLLILGCILLPRYYFYQIVVSESVAQLSDRIHVIVSLSLTITLLIVVIRNKDHAHKKQLLEKKKLEGALQELKETQSQLINSEKMASLGQMSAGINHELKNPLNFIQGSLETMKQNLNKETLKENENFFEIMDEGLKRLNRIVNSLNHFSHQSQNRTEECSIPELIDNCLNILEHKSKGRIDIATNYCEQHLVRGNSGQLHQVFLNLLGNAMQAIPNQGKIVISTQVDKHSIHVIIDDNGSGISPEVLDKIFDPFFTTKKAGQGTGLGLAISSKIVSDHNGSIVATSDPGYGSTFRVSLPFN
ncbi:sensor histidine kinase [Ekhidna sp. To15]|uniref:sensor histidine kinase n=1 Tax=Ekhidna sp. To15 TaxID=3395267 RepID=UPI003F51B5CF